MIVYIFEDISAGLNHPFFDYVFQDEKDDIRNTKNVHVAMFKQNEKEMFAAVIELLPDRIHVREVGGSFTRSIQWLEIYCQRLANYYGVKKISFCTVKPGVKTIGKRLGFSASNSPFEYEKVVA